jgi:integrase
MCNAPQPSYSQGMDVLTDRKLKGLKGRESLYRVADTGGLCIEVTPASVKLWRYRYRYHGKATMLALGTYPEVTLAVAREKHLEARARLNDGRNLVQERRSEKEKAKLHNDTTFEAVAREWLAQMASKWVETTLDQTTTRLEQDIFTKLGARPIAEIEAPELLQVLKRIEARGAYETAQRARADCRRVFAYAIQTGRAARNPANDLAGALATPKVKHHAAIVDPRAVGDLMRAIKGYQGAFLTRCALQLSPLLFVRPGELRMAEWSELDLDNDQPEWRIPGERMKMRVPHIVPLSLQAVGILREVQAVTGRGRYVFPGARTTARPMSENTVNAALRRMDYTSDQMTAHGFRSTASTLLNEQGWNRDAIERQLAHAEGDSVRAAYNRAEHLPERRKMMQAWADHLDALAVPNVVPFPASKRA